MSISFGYIVHCFQFILNICGATANSVLLLFLHKYSTSYERNFIVLLVNLIIADGIGSALILLKNLVKFLKIKLEFDIFGLIFTVFGVNSFAAAVFTLALSIERFVFVYRTRQKTNLKHANANATQGIDRPHGKKLVFAIVFIWLVSWLLNGFFAVRMLQRGTHVNFTKATSMNQIALVWRSDYPLSSSSF